MDDNATSRRPPGKTGPLLLLVGLGGLALGMLLFPSSNLLGGLGPIFGLVFGVGVIWTLVAGLAWGRRLLRRGERDGRE